MKKIFSVLLLCGLAAVSTAQRSCGFLQAQDYLFSQDPTARQRVQELLKKAREEAQLQGRTSAAANYTIPVVFHVLHTNGPENISDAQIQDQVAILTRDFTKQNPDTSNVVNQFQGLIGNPGIEFRLATIDPNGNCTNGITRHYDLNTNWNVLSSNYQYTWDRSRYMNIYVVKTMPPGVAAYAFYPGSVGPAMDAVVVQSDYVGSIGTGQPYTSRVVTHETGHWLNLEHLWGSNNQAGVACGDDGVNDTPITKGFTACNQTMPIDCTPGIVENIQNYMDYAYCQLMFTPGQCARMITALNSFTGARNNLWSPANLLATGVINPTNGCPPTAQFVPNNTITCVGNSVSFTDNSYGTINSWKWSSPLASNISNQQNGSLTFTASGLASVKLKVTNGFGSDSMTVQKVLVLPASGTGSANVVQGFETGNFPGSEWIAGKPQYGSSFSLTSQGFYNGANSAWINNFYDNPNGPVSIYSPAFNLQYASSATLSFYYAYAQQNSMNNDQFGVSISYNCGATWSSIFSTSGASMSILPGPLSTPYMASDPGEWQHVLVSVPLGSPKAYFKFEFTPDPTGSGNNFFIDDINLDAQFYEDASLRELQLSSWLLSPNPFMGSVTLSGEGLERITSMRLFDVSGRLLAGNDAPIVKQDRLQLDGLDNLSPGVYFMEVKAGEAKRSFKVVKQ